MTRVAVCRLAPAIVLALATPALAQTPTPPTQTGIVVQIARAATPTVIAKAITVAQADITCNLAPSPATASSVNPTKFEWTDPAVTGRVCQALVTAELNALPPDQYVGQASFTYSDGSVGGLSTPAAPFMRFTFAIPAGLRFAR